MKYEAYYYFNQNTGKRGQLERVAALIEKTNPELVGVVFCAHSWNNQEYLNLTDAKKHILLELKSNFIFLKAN